MNTGYILMAICIAGAGISGLAGSLLFSDFVNEVKGLLPGDKSLYFLHLDHPFPWDYKFWRTAFDEHRRKFPRSHRIAFLKACYTLTAMFGIGLLLCVFWVT